MKLISQEKYHLMKIAHNISISFYLKIDYDKNYVKIELKQELIPN
jgi:hypothetical protein